MKHRLVHWLDRVNHFRAGKRQHWSLTICVWNDELAAEDAGWGGKATFRGARHMADMINERKERAGEVPRSITVGWQGECWTCSRCGYLAGGDETRCADCGYEHEV